jgi:hypothetical protein
MNSIVPIRWTFVINSSDADFGNKAAIVQTSPLLIVYDCTGFIWHAVVEKTEKDNLITYGFMAYYYKLEKDLEPALSFDSLTVESGDGQQFSFEAFDLKPKSHNLPSHLHEDVWSTGIQIFYKTSVRHKQFTLRPRIYLFPAAVFKKCDRPAINCKPLYYNRSKKFVSC